MIPPRFTLLVLLALSVAQPAAGDPAERAKNKSAWSVVHSILTTQCLNCHAGERKKAKLDLSRRRLALAGGESGTAVIPGRPADSLLYQKLKAGEMPPRNPLTKEQIEAFARWIEEGAAYAAEPLTPVQKRAGPDWWSLRKIQRPILPSASNPGWVRSPVDAFVLAKLDEHNLRPAPEADRRTLIRRAAFDLTGLPPTPEEVLAFEGDASPLAYEKLIDRLLASPHYGERWARHWLDIVRFAESHGYEMNTLRPNAWPYRDYVISAFNADKPYSEFVREQLAGDATGGANLLIQSATGFLVGGAHDMVGNQTPDGTKQQRMDDLDDMITATSATFLGLTVNCARCHDHKFDPITQHDYYAFQAIFAGVQHTEREIATPENLARRREIADLETQLAGVEKSLDACEPIADAGSHTPRRPPVNPRRNVERFAPVEARYVRFTIAATNDGIEPCIDELEVFSAGANPRNVALASNGVRSTASSVYPNSSIHKLEHLNDGRHGNSRSWISNEPGKGWVQIEFPGSVRIDEIVWGRDREEHFADRLATSYRIEIAQRPGEWRLISSSADRLPLVAGSTGGSVVNPSRVGVDKPETLLQHRSRLQKRLTILREGAKVYAGTFTQPGPTNLLARGDPMRPGDAVAPGGPIVVKPPLVLDAAMPERARRQALARWISHPDNPLSARVMVNRLWHYHFGQGIVATPSDFGFNGDRPSHPELLDWLASEFIGNGGRLKPIQRTIMLSAAYRQSGKGDRHGAASDRGNRLIWHMPPRRLEAEALRDAVLAVNGQLDIRMGGEGYNIWEKNTNYVVVFKPKNELGSAEFRRMIYQFKPRSQQDPVFGIFDCPDAALAKPRRTASTTALQALNLLNSQFLIQQAECFAQRVALEAGTDSGAQVERAFRLAFARAPTSSERDAALVLIRGHGCAALCRALYNANEFLYVD